jgi:formate-dependent nitrite reductase membrane component NrfD
MSVALSVQEILSSPKWIGNVMLHGDYLLWMGLWCAIIFCDQVRKKKLNTEVKPETEKTKQDKTYFVLTVFTTTSILMTMTTGFSSLSTNYSSMRSVTITDVSKGPCILYEGRAFLARESH